MNNVAGPFLILAAALLWGTDSLFRYSMSSKIDATWIVLLEHLGIILLVPGLVRKKETRLFQLGWKEWLCAAITGVGGGALATTLFTASFRYIHPSVAILLQKLQPILTVLLAGVFLGEKPKTRFYPFALLGLCAALVLSFPDLNFRFIFETHNLHSRGIAMTLVAAGLWSLATIAGKRMLQTTPSEVATFWRYFFGLITLVGLVAAAKTPVPAQALTERPVQLALLYLTVLSGVVPMLAYYAGLARTTASVATFVELAYPVSAVTLNAWLMNQPLTQVQLGAGGVLLFSVTMMALL